MKCSLYFAMAIDRNKPYIAILLVQVIYAGMALFSKAAIAKGMNPYVFVAYRQAFATLALTPFAFFFERLVTQNYTLFILLWKMTFLIIFLLDNHTKCIGELYIFECTTFHQYIQYDYLVNVTLLYYY